jgi:hypothetical protein
MDLSALKKAQWEPRPARLTSAGKTLFQFHGKAARQPTVGLQHVRDQFRARNHEAMRTIVEMANAVAPDPLPHVFLRSADGLGGFSRCHVTTIKPISLVVKRVRASAQLGGKAGSLLDASGIGREIAEKLTTSLRVEIALEYRRHFRNPLETL